MNNYSNGHGYSQSRDWLVSIARRNPEALLLLAAGCALLMLPRRRSSSRSAIDQQASRSHQKDATHEWRVNFNGTGVSSPCGGAGA